MKILVCGDRNWTDISLMKEVFKTFPPDTTIIEGEARGADTLAGVLAVEFKFSLEKYPAKWKEYGRAAGPIRNRQMLDEGQPDRVIAFHDHIEQSVGTKDMIKQSAKRKISVKVYKHESDIPKASL
jgi:hypothetical protein